MARATKDRGPVLDVPKHVYKLAESHVEKVLKKHGVLEMTPAKNLKQYAKESIEYVCSFATDVGATINWPPKPKREVVKKECPETTSTKGKKTGRTAKVRARQT